MADIALVMCPNYNLGKYQRTRPPVTLHYLKGALDYYGLESTIIDSDGTLSDKDIAEQIADSGARVIGISADSSMHGSLPQFSTYLSEQTRLPIGIGGYISLLDDTMENSTAVTAMMKREGDTRVAGFFKALVGQGSLNDIQGIVYREQDGRIVDTGDAPQVPEEMLDIIMPDFSYIKTDDNGVRRAMIYSSRGCFFSCTYCNIRGIQGKGVRAMSDQKLYELIEYLANEHEVNRLTFLDDDFAFRPGRLDYFSELFRKHSITVELETRATSILRHQIGEELVRSKDFLVQVSKGTESYSDSQLERWNKRTTAEQNIRAIRFLHENEIPYRSFLMFIDGETTKQELEDNMRTHLSLSVELKNIIPLIQGFNHDFTPPFSYLKDIRGNMKIPEELAPFVACIVGSNENLVLYEDAITALDNSDHLYFNILVHGALALYITAFESIEEDKAAQDHLKLRDTLKGLHNLITPNSTEQTNTKVGVLELEKQVMEIGMDYLDRWGLFKW